MLFFLLKTMYMPHRKKFYGFVIWGFEAPSGDHVNVWIFNQRHKHEQQTREHPHVDSLPREEHIDLLLSYPR